MARRASIPDHDDVQPGQGDPLEAAAFISQSIEELAQLAHRHKLDVLGFLLDMTLLEAREIVEAQKAKREPNV